MKKIFSILYTSYKNYTAYFGDIVGINIIFVLRIIVIAILYGYLYKNFAIAGKISGFSIEQVTYAVIIAQVISTSKPKITDDIEYDVKSTSVR